MSISAALKKDQEMEMASLDGQEEEGTYNNGLCMSAGIKTPNEDDKSRFQRRHFPNTTTSDIFFSDLSLENMSVGIDTRNADLHLAQSEKRHFQHTSDDSFTVEDNTDHVVNEEIDSSESTEAGNAEEKPTQRRHFYDKMSSNIFFCGLPPEDDTVRDRADPCDFRKRKG